MFIPSLRRKTAVLLLTASLATPWAASAAVPRSPRPGAPLEVLSRAWSLLVSLWSGQTSTDTGCHIDPNGNCVKPATVAPTDTGCHIDPSGNCVKPAAVAPADTGCNIDPSGRCRQ